MLGSIARIAAACTHSAPTIVASRQGGALSKDVAVSRSNGGYLRLSSGKDQIGRSRASLLRKTLNSHRSLMGPGAPRDAVRITRTSKSLLALSGIALVGAAACSSTHNVYDPLPQGPAADVPAASPSSFSAAPPSTSADGSITTTNRLSTLTCKMVAGTDTVIDEQDATLTPAITVKNTSSSPLNLIQYLGGAVQFDIWFLNSSGGVVSLDEEDPDLGSAYDNATTALAPGQSTMFTAQLNPISGEVPQNENMAG
jgi:hypothetical protein